MTLRLFCFLSCLTASLVQAVDARGFEERLLDTIPEDVQVEGAPVFADTGERVGYSGVRGSSSVVLIDGELKDEDTFADSVIFSRDGQHYAYRLGARTSKTREKWCIVVDGEKRKSVDWVGPPSISDDGTTVAYWFGQGVKIGRDGIYEGGKYSVMHGKKAGKAYSDGETLTPPILSPYGSVVAYPAQKGKGWVAVIGRKESASFGLVGQPAVSGDGKKFAFPALVDSSWHIIDHKGQKGPEFQSIGECTLDPEGRIAFGARVGGKWLVVQGNRRWKGSYDAIGRPVFSADGKRLAVAANRGGRDIYADFPPGMPRPPVPAGMVGVQGGKWLVVTDEKEGTEFDAVTLPVFSADGKTLAYAAKSGDKWVLIVDGKGGEEFDLVSRPVFSEDGGQIGFGVQIGRELWWKVVPVP